MEYVQTESQKYEFIHEDQLTNLKNKKFVLAADQYTKKPQREDHAP